MLGPAPSSQIKGLFPPPSFAGREAVKTTYQVWFLESAGDPYSRAARHSLDSIQVPKKQGRSLAQGRLCP